MESDRDGRYLSWGDDVMKWREWQAIADDEGRWLNHQERGVLKAEHLADFILRVWFEEDLDVSIYELDFRPLFVEENPGGVFALLKDEERFRHVRGDYALIWPSPESGAYDEHAIDLAPECVRFFCERYGKRITRAHQERVA